MRTVKYIVKVTLPDTITGYEMITYIRSAVHWWRKGGDPESPLCNLPDRAFSVKAQTVQRNDAIRRTT